MIITSISKTAHKRYDILVDGETILSIHEDVLVKYGLHKGMEIELNDLTELVESEEYHKVVQACMRYLSYRPRTIWEATTYLQGKGYSHHLVGRVVDEMKSHGYIDDRKFAGTWVAERQSTKRLGIARLKQELKQKGISSAIIEEVIQMDHIDEERQLVTEVAERRYSRLRHEEWTTIERRLNGYLLRRGFPSHLIRQVLQQLRNTHNQGE